MSKQLTFRIYSNDGEAVYHCCPQRIDVVDSHTVIYLNKRIFTVPFNVASTNVERGIITVYYCNNFYAVIHD